MGKEGREELVSRLVTIALDGYAMRPGDPGFPVIVVSGSGGIGKTTAVEQMIDALRQRSLSVVRLPTLGLAPRALDFDLALERALDSVRGPRAKALLVADPFDELWGLGGWLVKRARDSGSRICGLVIASRKGAPRRFAAEVARHGQLTEIEIPELTQAEAVSLCADFGVPALQGENLYQILGGHPLSLALASEHEARRLVSGDSGDQVRGATSESALEGLARELPSRTHYEVLLASLMVPQVERGLLRALFSDSHDIDALFDFLFELSFMQPRGGRLSAHDIVRHGLLEDAFRRRPRLLASVYERVYSYLLGARERGDAEACEALAFLIMQHPMVRPMFAGADGLSVNIRGPSPQKIEEAAAVVARVEGERAAQLFRMWCRVEGSKVETVEDECGRVRGLFVQLRDEALSSGGREDPVVERFLVLAQERGISTGRSFVRFWFALDAYQSPKEPWVTVVNQAITRSNIDFSPRLPAICHLLDPAWRGVIESLILSSPGGYCDLIPGESTPTALCLRFPPADGHRDFLWRFLFSVRDDQVDEPLRVRSVPALASPGPVSGTLSDREVAVMRLIAEGYRYDQIAERLGLSLGTVRTYIRRAYSKLGVSTKSEATLLAMRQGLLE